MNFATFTQTLRISVVALAGLGVLSSVGCMAKERKQVNPVKADYTYNNETASLDLDEVFAPQRPVLTAAEFDRTRPVPVVVD